MQSETRGPERALVVMAHPDDAEFAAGGTLARWCAQGWTVDLVVVTDGSRGSADPLMTPSRLAELRAAEQRAAAAVLGLGRVDFLGWPDGEVQPDLRLRHAITREIRLRRPDLVMTHDPATLYWDHHINHPDHRAVGQATLDAVFPTARDRLNAPQLLADGLEPHVVRTVYLAGALQPDTWEDISEAFERKLAALREHGSQIPDQEALRRRLLERHRGLAEGHGMDLAEVFKVIRLS